MALFDTPRTVVLLPGTGSDVQFVEDAFLAAVSSVGARLIAVRPDPSNLVDGYRDALDRAASETSNPLVVGGVSIGAAVALEWAAGRPGDVAGVIAALPAWTGDGVQAPAGASARATASLLRAVGLDEAVDAMAGSSPPWLATMLTRSWREQWPHLPGAMEEAAAFDALTAGVLRSAHFPVGITAALDDPVHPIDVAREWSALLPVSSTTTLTLDQLGAEPALLGRLALQAVSRAAGHR